MKKIWQFAILLLFLGYAIWLGSLAYKGISHEINLAVEHKQL